MKSALTLFSILINIILTRQYILHVNMLNTSQLVLEGFRKPTIVKERRWIQQSFCESKQAARV